MFDPIAARGGACGRRPARWATAQPLSTANRPVRRQPHRPQIHGAALVGRPDSVLVSRVRAQPVAPWSSQLVAKHLGVHALAFVAKPEQLLERTSHLARMGYDERYP
jgi:hypothetical protein